MRVNTRYINSTRGTLEDVRLVEFMYLVFTAWAEKAGNDQGQLYFKRWFTTFLNFFNFFKENIVFGCLSQFSGFYFYFLLLSLVLKKSFLQTLP